jgi:peptidoglycan/LPS O-acetylase OafA/YrhL
VGNVRTRSSQRNVVLKQALRQHNIPGLDALRVLAITMVILYHVDLHAVSGFLGVIIFFVLSGFLITSILLREIERTGTLRLGNFYRRRAFRIFPAFYVCWLVTIIVLLCERQKLLWTRLALSFFYLADYGRAFINGSEQLKFPMGISWSLAIEEKFYLLWPLLLLWVVRRKRQEVTIACVIVGFWMWRAILVLGFHVSLDYVYNAFDTRAGALLVGCLLAKILSKAGEIPSWLNWTLARKWFILIPLLLIAAIGIHEVSPSDSAGWFTFEFTVAPLVAAVLLVQMVYWGAVEMNWLEKPIIKLMARLSYAIYLYHPIAIDLVNHLGLKHGKAILSIVLFMAMAFASYYGVERPFLRWRDRSRGNSVLLEDH